MNYRENRHNDSFNPSLFFNNTSMQDWLDLLCEDGFLSPAEIMAAKHTAKKQLELLRRSIRRGFLIISKNVKTHGCCYLIVKAFSLLCVWKNLTNHDIRLRAPPIALL